MITVVIGADPDGWTQTKRKDDRRPPWGGGREREKQAPDAVTALAFTSSKTKRRSWVRAVGTEEAVDDEAGLVKKAMVQIRNNNYNYAPKDSTDDAGGFIEGLKRPEPEGRTGADMDQRVE